jgi:hypothetical protein
VPRITSSSASSPNGDGSSGGAWGWGDPADNLPDVATSSSSTKKAAKLAQKGKGSRIRFQGGTVFPIAVAATLILGLALIVYARQSLPAADSSPPTINDHWHAAYGFDLCGDWYQLKGDLEERNSQGQFVNTEFLRTGIHSHDDGVIHWHPYTAASVGRRATLGVFLQTYGVDLTNDSLTFPSADSLEQNPDFPNAEAAPPLDSYVEGETTCDGQPAELSVRAWGSFTDTDGGQRYIADMDKIHVDNDNMVFAIYFLPKDADQSMPPWAQNLPALGAADTNQPYPGDLPPTTVLPGDSVPATTADTTNTTSPDTTPSSTSPDTTPSSTDTAPSTTGG